LPKGKYNRESKFENECFPFFTVRRILTKAGVKRANKEAVKEMIKVLEGIGLEIAKESNLIAHNSPHSLSFKERETLTAEDVAIAARRVLSQDLQ